MSGGRDVHHYRPHPWHGLSPGKDPPRMVTAYIEITPFDLVKYESDKRTGYLRVDRPQTNSSLPPTLYGFVPQTLCGERVASLCPLDVRGDDDPLDICVISERPINRADVLLDARVVGGLQMVDANEADDKIVAVLRNDTAWSEAREISHLPKVLIERLRHYFETYKGAPGAPQTTHIECVYDSGHAFAVIEAAMADYRDAYAGGA
jgi:inorganic pyrophosphatase